VRHDDEKEGRFFIINEAVPLLKWSSISEYSVSYGKRRFARARQHNYNKRCHSLPASLSFVHLPFTFFVSLCRLEGFPSPRANVCSHSLEKA